MSEKKIVRWGILGAGKIAHAFAKDFKYLQNAQLVAVAASDSNRARTFAEQYNIANAYTYEQLYNSNEVDAVYICTTHNFHYQQCLNCLQQGKAVLCEKSITINDQQLKELVALSQQKKVFLMEAMWTHFLPAVQKAMQWLAGGRIGKLSIISADFGILMPYDVEGRIFNPKLAGGAMLDLGIYPVALTTFFTGRKPQTITASGVVGPTGVDERSSMILQYGDVTTTITISIVTQLTNEAFLFGDKGYIKIEDFYRAPSASIYNAKHQLVETFVDDRTSHGFIYEMQEATNQILKGEIESIIVPQQRSIIFQEIMTEARRQIGMVYPEEK